jgi:4-hydroxy-4-methyl-2-oxoglutarate aldolase
MSQPLHARRDPRFQRGCAVVAQAAAVVHPGRRGQGRRGALHGRIAPLRPHMKLAGPALTVEVRPGDNLMIHAALALAQPGDVIW